MKRDAMLLVDALRDPASTGGLDADGWTALLAMARAEQLIGTLARRLAGYGRRRHMEFRRSIRYRVEIDPQPGASLLRRSVCGDMAGANLRVF